MPHVKDLAGKVYELDEETLAKGRISDEEVRKLGMMPVLPPPLPAAPPGIGAAQQGSVGERLDGSTGVDGHAGGA